MPYQAPGLHKGRKARNSRDYHARKKAAPLVRTIYFEDRGQDFIWWTIDAKGLVVDCGPFQASVWCKCVVLGSKKLNVGEHPQFLLPGELKERTLSYSVTKIEAGVYPHPGTEGVCPTKFLKLLRAPASVLKKAGGS